MSDYIVETNKLSCKVGYKYLLHDVTWKVKKGEHWVVFGMNGSGKTTLLSIIAGLKHYTSGDVKVFDEHDNILDIRKRTGWVSASFFDKYYSRESALNIVLSGKSGTLGLENDITLDDVVLAKELLETLNLGDKMNRTFDMLSKGERQNVLIARALFPNPDMLILDEPCTGLDIYNRSYLFDTINQLSEKKKLTIIYVTHYVEEIIPLFDHILYLKNGNVFAQGKIGEMLNESMLENLLDYPVDLFAEPDGTYRLAVESHSTLARMF
ncbi:MAG: ATP-binding cassette domain-containing protein [Peptococcaceae bacterium]|nr:ATP-binding cassette domain-containing protein [Peptococcaceae bacterium]